MQPAVRPRPRGQALGREPAREDAGAPLKRHWLVLFSKSISLSCLPERALYGRKGKSRANNKFGANFAVFNRAKYQQKIDATQAAQIEFILDLLRNWHRKRMFYEAKH